jgi:myo-inositol-1(or 4)-monophosphatase
LLRARSAELYEAVSGEGARLNGETIRVDGQASLGTGLVGLGASHRIAAVEISTVLQALLESGGMFVRSGSGALSIAEVAAGRLCAYYEPHINAWDCLAALLIVREAGGFTAEFPGEGRSLLDGGPVLAAAPQVARPLNELIARARQHTS